jgi:hypothetical protein
MTTRKNARKDSGYARDASREAVTDAKIKASYVRGDEPAKLTPLQHALALNLAAVLDNPETPADLYNAIVDQMVDYQVLRGNNLDFVLQCVRGMAQITADFGGGDESEGREVAH